MFLDANKHSLRKREKGNIYSPRRCNEKIKDQVTYIYPTMPKIHCFSFVSTPSTYSSLCGRLRAILLLFNTILVHCNTSCCFFYVSACLYPLVLFVILPYVFQAQIRNNR